MKTIVLKCKQPYFDNVERGFKKFEIRKNDRNFNPGDKVFLVEVDEHDEPTGRQIPALEIQYVMHGPMFGIEAGYCIFNW